MSSIWRYDDGEYVGFDPDLVLMTMDASEAPVLVRKDPEDDWIIIAQGPPGTIHAHVVTHDDVASLGVPTLWHAAVIGAREHVAMWKRAQQAEQAADREPVPIGTLIDALLEELEARRIAREENPDAETPDPS